MEQELAEHTEHTTADVSSQADTQTDTVEIVDELLIEEISIDGMCGVY